MSMISFCLRNLASCVAEYLSLPELNTCPSHGYDVLVLERAVYLQLLYDCLPDKSQIRLGAQVTEIIDGIDGVEARLADGTVEKGDMIVGCDGAYSMVRESMWNSANTRDPCLIKAAEKMCMFHALFTLLFSKDSAEIKLS